ncbi:hypothetical protein NFI96_030298 [Prochilodus magdalenae]|nr:hypothetical protein NFI96_030298 [Prochilodus magdalenae]
MPIPSSADQLVGGAQWRGLVETYPGTIGAHHSVGSVTSRMIALDCILCNSSSTLSISGNGTLRRVARLLFDCKISEQGCAALVSALNSNPSHLRKLILSDNTPRESGVKLLSGLLEHPHCKLEKLHLSNCWIAKEDWAALVSALKSNPSHLRDLDLSSNNLGESGVKLLSDLLEDPHCKLEKLRDQAPTSTLYESLTRRHGVKVECRVSVEECCLLVGSVVGHSNIVSASRMNNAVALFLNTVQRANDLVQTGIVLQDQLTPVHPLSTPAKKVILSNIPPFLKDEHLARDLSRLGTWSPPFGKSHSAVNPPWSDTWSRSGRWSTWF